MDSALSGTPEANVPVFVHADGTRIETIDKKFDYRQMQLLISVISPLKCSGFRISVIDQQIVFVSHVSTQKSGIRK